MRVAKRNRYTDWIRATYLVFEIAIIRVTAITSALLSSAP
jgi:hypothetical protein